MTLDVQRFQGGKTWMMRAGVAGLIGLAATAGELDPVAFTGLLGGLLLWKGPAETGGPVIGVSGLPLCKDAGLNAVAALAAEIRQEGEPRVKIAAARDAAKHFEEASVARAINAARPRDGDFDA